MLVCSAGIIFYLSKTSTGLKTKYPKTNCVNEKSQYVGSDAVYTVENWEKDAYNEYVVQDSYEKKGEPTHYTETL